MAIMLIRQIYLANTKNEQNPYRYIIYKVYQTKSSNKKKQ